MECVNEPLSTPRPLTEDTVDNRNNDAVLIG